MDYTWRTVPWARCRLPYRCQMHAFTIPQMLVGARAMLIEAPVPDLVLRLIEQQQNYLVLLAADRLDQPAVSGLRHARSALAAADLLWCVDHPHGARCCGSCTGGLPNARPYNCYGQTEIAPLATVLRPEEHDARPASCGQPALNVATRVVDPDADDVPPGTHGEIVHLLAAFAGRLLEQAEENRGSLRRRMV